MSEDWQAIAAEVTTALGDTGHTGTLLRPGPKVGPEWDPSFGTDIEIPVKLLGDTLGLGLIDGAAIQASDRREMMAAEGTAPTPADKLRIGATVYAIIRAEPYAPGGEPVYFDLILRA